MEFYFVVYLNHKATLKFIAVTVERGSKLILMKSKYVLLRMVCYYGWDRELPICCIQFIEIYRQTVSISHDETEQLCGRAAERCSWVGSKRQRRQRYFSFPVLPFPFHIPSHSDVPFFNLMPNQIFYNFYYDPINIHVQFGVQLRLQPNFATNHLSDASI